MLCRICRTEFSSPGDYEPGEPCVCGGLIPIGDPLSRFYCRHELLGLYLKVIQYRLAALLFALGNRLIGGS